jgi:hypothetical protein
LVKYYILIKQLWHSVTPISNTLFNWDNQCAL